MCLIESGISLRSGRRNRPKRTIGKIEGAGRILNMTDMGSTADLRGGFQGLEFHIFLCRRISTRERS